MKFDLIVAIFPNLVANDYKSHVVVNGLVTFWLISTSDLIFELVSVRLRGHTYLKKRLLIIILDFCVIFHMKHEAFVFQQYCLETFCNLSTC